jgi:hypothetical protein
MDDPQFTYITNMKKAKKTKKKTKNKNKNNTVESWTQDWRRRSGCVLCALYKSSLLKTT